AWEAMSLTSYFLVAFEDLESQVRRAGLLYLVASHFGAACLLLLFPLMAGGTGAFHFSDFAAVQRAPGVATACFMLALAGFGLKAGLWPLHFWLPEAHPAAPSHVSALMSGAMIEMGIYGLLRVLPMVSVPPTWWGLALAAVGGVTALFGVLGAVTQRDLKRVLAYSSVENMGIVAMAAGAGFLGRAAHHPQMAILGFGAALTHLLNHGLFKGLLFQCAGAIFHGTGTRDLERLGGLRTAMPMTGALFLTGAIAACGLPPLNGFPGEWLLFRSAFAGLGGHSASGALVGALGMAALALVGGLAAAAFARAHGVVFLGLPRSPDSPRAHETPLGELMPMALGAALCLALGLFPGIVLGLVAPAAAALSGAPPSSARLLLSANGVPSALLVLVALAAGLALLRSWLLSGRDVRSGPVWGCGYEQPDARMQYTAASFPEPAATSFGTLLRSSEAGERPAGYFPASSSSEERLDDLAADGFLAPALAKFAEAMRGVRRFQPGRVQIYLVYVFATVLVLLVWQVGGAW
ncbi:MAG: hypothetical protein HY303_06460, partial [Candidatus Wallbacteria bacterium]|nr:hypothetical protein [Candidatus Wallbacteria bacterium]